MFQTGFQVSCYTQTHTDRETHLHILVGKLLLLNPLMVLGVVGWSAREEKWEALFSRKMQLLCPFEADVSLFMRQRVPIYTELHASPREGHCGTGRQCPPGCYLSESAPGCRPRRPASP